MIMARNREVTHLLEQWSDGDEAALGQLIPLVVDELRIIARSYLARHPHGGGGNYPPPQPSNQDDNVEYNQEQVTDHYT